MITCRVNGVKRVLVAALAVLGTACGRSDPALAIDLVESFASAIEVRPGPAVFSIADVSVGSQSNRAIVVNGSSRLVYQVTVPERGELRAAVGLPDAVDGAKSSVLFRVMVATDGSPGPDVLLSRRLDATNPADLGWQQIAVNLAPFATETVSIYFNTNTEAGVRAAWATPRIVGR